MVRALWGWWFGSNDSCVSAGCRGRSEPVVIVVCSSETRRERISACSWGTLDACEIWGRKKEGAETVCTRIGPVLNTGSQLCSKSHTWELSSDLVVSISPCPESIWERQITVFCFCYKHSFPWGKVDIEICNASVSPKFANLVLMAGACLRYSVGTSVTELPGLWVIHEETSVQQGTCKAAERLNWSPVLLIGFTHLYSQFRSHEEEPFKNVQWHKGALIFAVLHGGQVT